MPYVLLILLLASATCFGHEAQCDSVSMALRAIPEDALVVKNNTNQLQLPYMYDNSKTLLVDFTSKTVKLVNDKNQVFAEGKYTQPDAASPRIYPVGHWRYYHSNGTPSCEGDYVLAPYAWIDTIVKEKTATGKEQVRTKKVIRYNAMQTGNWQHYNAEGMLTSTESFE